MLMHILKKDFIKPLKRRKDKYIEEKNKKKLYPLKEIKKFGGVKKKEGVEILKGGKGFVHNFLFFKEINSIKKLIK